MISQPARRTLASEITLSLAAQPLMVLPSSCWPRPPLPLRAFRSHLSSVRAAERTSQLPPSPYKKRHALLTFGYCGTNYWGLQSQTALGDPEAAQVHLA